MPRERPILFSGPMVRALLAGRKTQTRRLIRMPFLGPSDGVKRRVYGPGDIDQAVKFCPHGRVGGKLWVRETMYRSGGYVATDAPPHADAGKVPSIFMRRHDSRITLEVTDVRVQRLHDISDADVVAEGLDLVNGDRRKQDAFAELWDALNADRAPWKSNPWVWAISFALLGPATPTGGEEA